MLLKETVESPFIGFFPEQVTQPSIKGSLSILDPTSEQGDKLNDIFRCLLVLHSYKVVSTVVKSSVVFKGNSSSNADYMHFVCQ